MVAKEDTSELTHPCGGEKKFSNAAKLNHHIKCFFSLRRIGITKTGVRMISQQDVHITTAGTAAFHSLKTTPVSDCWQFPKEGHQVSLSCWTGFA